MVNGEIPFLRLKTGLLLGCLLIFCCALEAAAQNWKELKGDHFIIYYTRGKKFAQNTLEKAEEYYKKIADDLGYARHAKFWSWDERVKIYVHPTHKAYLSYIKSMGYAEWSIGFADYTSKEIVSYHQSEGFLDAVLPHEITHLIFRDYVGMGKIPMWIDEGVAQWEEEGKRQLVKERLIEILDHHSPIPMNRMMTLNIGKIDNEFIVELYYLQAVSLIDFLITRFGAERFIYLCRQLRDGKTIDDALQFAFPTTIRNTENLQSEWMEYLQVNNK